MNQKEIIINTTRRVTKNVGALLVGTIVNRFCALTLLAVASRYLGADGLGKYTFASSFTALFILLGDIGLNILAIREVAGDRSLISKYLGNISILKTILSTLAVGMIFLVITLLNYPLDTTKIVYIIGISVFFSSLSNAFRWCFQAFQKMEYEALVNVAEGGLLLGIGFLALYLGKGLIGLAYAFLLTHIIVFIFSLLITVKKFAKPKFEISWDFWKFLIRNSIPIGLAGIFSTVYLNIDTVMLSVMKGDTPVGWYNAGYKLVNFIKFMPTVFVLAIFPVISSFFKTSIESFRTVLRKSVQFMFLLALPIAIGITILSSKIVPIIFGEGFLPAVFALQILIWAGALAFLGGIAGNTLIAVNKQIILVNITLVGLLINIILNLILIPRFSYTGSAIAIVIAELAITFLLFLYIYKNLKVNLLSPKLFKIILASLLMGGFTWFIRDFNIILVILLSVIFYFATLIGTKTIARSDLKLVCQIL